MIQFSQLKYSFKFNVVIIIIHNINIVPLNVLQSPTSLLPSRLSLSCHFRQAIKLSPEMEVWCFLK